MILTFNDIFTSELENKSSMNGKSEVLRNRRYYFTRLKILHENIYICLPLHSNAGFYYVKILIPSNKKEIKSNKTWIKFRKTSIINTGRN